MSESIFLTFILSPSYRGLPGRLRQHQPFHFLHDHWHEGKIQNRGFAFWGLWVGQVLQVPHSTLPGFMRPRGSSVSLSCRIVSTPTGPTSSWSSCLLPSPMPCSPVHVPWSARARLGGPLKDSAAFPLSLCPPQPHPSLAPSSPAQIFCKGLDPLLFLHIIWVNQQDAVKVAITHMPNNGS